MGKLTVPSLSLAHAPGSPCLYLTLSRRPGEENEGG